MPEELQELQSEPLVGLGDGGASTDKAKRMIFWVVQVKNVEGEIKERPIRVRDADPLPVGEIVLIPFDGPQPIDKDVDGLIGGYLGQ